MILIVNGKPISEEATDLQITNALYSLSNKKDTLILSKDNMESMRSKGIPTSGFVLEYQGGPIGENYKCVNSSLSIEQVAKAFKNYLAQNEKWKTDLSWEKATFSPIGRNSGGKIVNILTLLGLAAYFIWKYFFSA